MGITASVTNIAIIKPPMMVVASGLHLQHGVEEGVCQMWTISALQMHPHAIIVADEAACGELKVDTYKYFKDIEKDNLI